MRGNALLPLLVSAGVHVGLALAPRPRPEPPPRRADEVVEIEVRHRLPPPAALLPPSPAPPSPAPAPPPPLSVRPSDAPAAPLPARPAPAPRRIASPASDAPPAASVAAPAAPRLLAMRGAAPSAARATDAPAGPRARDLSPSRGAAAVVDVGPPAEAIPPGADIREARDEPNPEADYDMRPSGGGTYTVDRPGYKARVERDGSVTFDDKPSAAVSVRLPCLRCTIPELRKWQKDPFHYEPVMPGFIPLVGMRFDLTDLVMRAIGDDPYASDKARLLDATRDRREGMSATSRHEQLRDSLARLPRVLGIIWSAPRPAAERRALLFRLWDECAEEGAPELIHAGTEARATIVGFIRRRLPAGSPDAYAPDELATLNAHRRSRSPFDPYAP